MQRVFNYLSITTICYCVLTAWYFLEVYKFLVSIQRSACGVVAVDIALLEPWIVVASKTVRSRRTSLLASFQRFVLAVQLGTTGNEEPFLN